MTDPKNLFGKNCSKHAQIGNLGGGSHRAPYSRLNGPHQHLLKNDHQPVLRDKWDISPRNVPDKREPPSRI